jgi:hypothetical protein
MSTALDLITGAARLLGVVRKGEALDADEASDGLSALNDMLASWSSERLFVSVRTRDNFTLTASATHTIGTGQTLNTVAPIRISDAFIRNGDLDYPLTIITDEEYDSLALKTLAASPPSCINYIKSNTSNVGTIRLYPVPSASDSLYLLSEKVATQVALTSDTVFLPHAGFKRAIKYNLAIDLAPEYGVEPSNAVVAIAKTSLGAIKLEVARNMKMRAKVFAAMNYLAIEADGA